MIQIINTPEGLNLKGTLYPKNSLFFGSFKDNILITLVESRKLIFDVYYQNFVDSNNEPYNTKEDVLLDLENNNTSDSGSTDVYGAIISSLNIIEDRTYIVDGDTLKQIIQKLQGQILYLYNQDIAKLKASVDFGFKPDVLANGSDVTFDFTIPLIFSGTELVDHNFQIMTDAVIGNYGIGALNNDLITMYSVDSNRLDVSAAAALNVPPTILYLNIKFNIA